MGDEHYNFQRNVRGSHHVLATLDERTYNPGVNGKGQDHPITWCKLYDGADINDNTGVNKTYRDGRTWVTAMGHFGASYTENGGNNPLIKQIVGGTAWVAGGGKKTDCSGTVWSGYRRTVLVANANQPIGIDVSKDGKVFWSEAGLAGTAANNYNSEGSIVHARSEGRPRQQDDRRGRSRRAPTTATPRTASSASRCSRASTWPTRPSGTCSRTTRRVPAPVTTGPRA